MSSRDVWAVVSDLHCGSTLGLCHPDGQQLDDGGHYLPSRAQGLVWEKWEDYWSRVKARLGAKDRLFVALNGDLVDGDHHRTAQIVSKNLPATQHAIAMRALEPMLALDPTGIVVVRGTEAHVGGSAAYEERLARELNAIPETGTGARSWWHFQAESQGVLLDFAHHGRIGTRPWTRMTGLSTMVSEIIQAAARQGVRAPDLVIRSHYHQHGDTYDNYPTRLIQTCAWQLATAFVHRIAAGSAPHIGGLIVTCESGQYSVENVRYPWKRVEPWSTAIPTPPPAPRKRTRTRSR